MDKKRVFVAMSGGVDSSVAAALLLKRGYEVVGCHIKCYNIDGCGEKDAEDARRVAEQLGVPFYAFDLEEEYKERVVDYMVDGYRRGLTPNPDVMCNKEIKFGLFLNKALSLGADYIATGHYIRLTRKSEIRDLKSKKIASSLRLPAGRQAPRNDGDFVIASPALRGEAISLQIARDLNKDQSYFLWTLTQNQLKHCLFPIGDYTKKEVRALAKKFGLITAEKKDSQGICFLGKVALADFLKQYIPEKRGIVLSTAGEKIGEHRGAHFYTIGQRRGFQMQNEKCKNQNDNLKLKNDLTRPYYVVDKNVKANTLIAAPENNPALYQREIKLTDVNFIFSPKFKILSLRDIPRRGKNSKFKIPVWARIRYRQPLQEAILIRPIGPIRPMGPMGPMGLIGPIELVFERSQKAVAPGQSAVFYSRQGEMLGGGIIA